MFESSLQIFERRIRMGESNIRDAMEPVYI